MAAVLCAGSLALAGCGSKGAGAASSSGSASAVIDRSMCQDPSFAASHATLCGGTGSPRPAIQTEGSVTTADGVFIQYPDGLRGQITAVKAKPNDAEHPDDSHPDANELLTVTFELSNTGTSPVPLDGTVSGVQTTLYYGVNRYTATSWMTDPNGVQDLPQQLVPGTNASFDQEFTLPSSGLSVLAVKFQPDQNHSPYTFTDVQTLVH